jgi:hypothetical protein
MPDRVAEVQHAFAVGLDQPRNLGIAGPVNGG